MDPLCLLRLSSVRLESQRNAGLHRQLPHSPSSSSNPMECNAMQCNPTVYISGACWARGLGPPAFFDMMIWSTFSTVMAASIDRRSDSFRT